MKTFVEKMADEKDEQQSSRMGEELAGGLDKLVDSFTDLLKSEQERAEAQLKNQE